MSAAEFFSCRRSVCVRLCCSLLRCVALPFLPCEEAVFEEWFPCEREILGAGLRRPSQRLSPSGARCLLVGRGVLSFKPSSQPGPRSLHAFVFRVSALRPSRVACANLQSSEKTGLSPVPSFASRCSCASPPFLVGFPVVSGSLWSRTRSWRNASVCVCERVCAAPSSRFLAPLLKQQERQELFRNALLSGWPTPQGADSSRRRGEPLFPQETPKKRAWLSGGGGEFLGERTLLLLLSAWLSAVSLAAAADTLAASFGARISGCWGTLWILLHRSV